MKLGVVLTAFAAAAWLNAASPDLRRLPVAYKQNRGQFASDVLFETSGLGQKLSIFRHGVRFQLQNGQSRTSMEMDWADSGASAQVEGEDQLIGASNYLIGSDRQKWISSIPSYQRIRVRGAFPGIDLVLYAKNDRLEYDLVVSPGADVRSIALRFAGADRFEKSAAGDLEVHSGPFTVVQCRPKIYQQSDGKKVEVTGEYVLQQGGQVGFRVSAYRHNEPLVIDPVLSFSTLFGGTGTIARKALRSMPRETSI